MEVKGFLRAVKWLKRERWLSRDTWAEAEADRLLWSQPHRLGRSDRSETAEDAV